MPSGPVLALPVLVIWVTVLALLMMAAKAHPEEQGSPQPRSDPSDEIELLRYENAVLRADQQRALSIGNVGERIRERLGTVTTSSSDEGDENWGALMEATVLRHTLLSVCQDLQTAIRNVQVQLGAGIPLPEIDRRQNDSTRDSRSTETASILQPADHARNGLPAHTENRRLLGE